MQAGTIENNVACLLQICVLFKSPEPYIHVERCSILHCSAECDGWQNSCSDNSARFLALIIMAIYDG